MGAEGTDRPLFRYKVIHRVIHSLWTVGNAVGSVGKPDPRVLKTTAGTYIRGDRSISSMKILPLV
jgi:hypothetical protein